MRLLHRFLNWLGFEHSSKLSAQSTMIEAEIEMLKMSVEVNGLNVLCELSIDPRLGVNEIFEVQKALSAEGYAVSFLPLVRRWYVSRPNCRQSDSERPFRHPRFR